MPSRHLPGRHSSEIDVAALVLGIMSFVGSLGVVWLYSARLEVFHNGLNAVLVVASIATLLQSALRVSLSLATISDLKQTNLSCNIFLPLLVGCITLATCALACFYIHVVLVRKLGEKNSRRFLKLYALIVSAVVIATVTFSAYEFAAEGDVLYDGKASFCHVPPLGHAVFLAPLLMEVIMLFVALWGITAIFCRRQTLSSRCRSLLLFRAVYVVIIVPLRFLLLIDHAVLGSPRGNEGGNSTTTQSSNSSFSPAPPVTIDATLSAFGEANEIFDAANGLILFLLFFGTERGFTLVRAMGRRRWRRFLRAWRTADSPPRDSPDAAEKGRAPELYAQRLTRGSLEGRPLLHDHVIHDVDDGGVDGESSSTSADDVDHGECKLRRRHRTDLQKDMMIHRDALSTMLSNISETLSGTRASDRDNSVGDPELRIDSMPRHADDERFA